MTTSSPERRRENVLTAAAEIKNRGVDDVLMPVCTAATEGAALERFAEFADAWAGSIRRSCGSGRMRGWEYPRTESGGGFTPFLRFDTEIRRIVRTTDVIESVNARIRRAVKARGHFPDEQAALKCVYRAVMSLDPTGKGQARWTMRWKTALNAFDITFDGRLFAARQQPSANPVAPLVRQTRTRRFFRGRQGRPRIVRGYFGGPHVRYVLDENPMSF
ncbi:transposase [Streptomyces prasinus]|uniref:transposase n=1 Tax=Streptomyces prasinus TaxID=67345 RepID=UPI003642221B